MLIYVDFDLIELIGILFGIHDNLHENEKLINKNYNLFIEIQLTDRKLKSKRTRKGRRRRRNLHLF